MKINEVINEKKRVDEVLPLVPLAIACGNALAGAMGAGKAGVAAHAAKVAANKGRQWLTKAPPDSSVPDAMKNKDMVPGPQAYHKKAVAGAGVKKPKPQGKLSPAAGAAIAQAQQVKR